MKLLGNASIYTQTLPFYQPQPFSIEPLPPARAEQPCCEPSSPLPWAPAARYTQPSYAQSRLLKAPSNLAQPTCRNEVCTASLGSLPLSSQ